MLAFAPRLSLQTLAAILLWLAVVPALCSAQSSEDDTAIRKAAAEYFKERKMRTSRKMSTPDSLFAFRQTMEPSVAGIVYKEYDEKRVAIVVVRMDAYLDGSDMTRDQWLFAMRQARKRGNPHIPDDSVLTETTEQRVSMMHTHMGLAAVLLERGWEVYQKTPYLPSAEAEQDFKSEMKRVVAAYNSRIK